MRPSFLPLAALTVLLFFAGALQPAVADDWGDARADFRDDMREESWKIRRGAFLPLLDFDGVKAFEEVLAATLKDKNAAVVLEGIKTLGTFQTREAQGALLAELARAKGAKAVTLLMALADQKGHNSADALLALLGDKDPQKAALAAIALGRKAVPEAFPRLLDLLTHEVWQVASAAARGLHALAWSAWTKPNTKKGEVKQPKMPAWFDVEKARWALIDALENAEGTVRGDIILALEHVTAKDYGDNWEAWVAYARGEEIGRDILKKRVHPPYLMGVPVWGKRTVIVKDANVLTDREHPFKDRTRLQELCEVPGARGVAWFNIRSVKHFNDAWVKRFVQDMPTRGTRFELVFSGLKRAEAFGKLQPSNPGTKKRAIVEIAKASVENGNDVLSAMTYALDISGRKESVAWSKGPDVVCCVYSSVPWQAQETDPEVVGATIGLMARRRLVKIHAIGVHEYAYAMMKLFANQSGGTYLELTK